MYTNKYVKFSTMSTISSKPIITCETIGKHLKHATIMPLGYMLALKKSKHWCFFFVNQLYKHINYDYNWNRLIPKLHKLNNKDISEYFLNGQGCVFGHGYSLCELKHAILPWSLNWYQLWLSLINHMLGKIF